MKPPRTSILARRAEMRPAKVFWWGSAVMSGGLLVLGGGDCFLLIGLGLILGFIGGYSSASLSGEEGRP